MKKNNKGQSTIEFILTFTAAVGFIFLFLKMSVNYTNGFMVHHATFMASRAYLVVDSEGDQTIQGRDNIAFKQAQAVFLKNMTEDLSGQLSGKLKVNHPDNSRLSVFTGVYAEYSQRFSIGFVGGKEAVTFRSESFLGREPTRVEVIDQVCAAVSDVTQASCNIHATLDDNGG